MLTRCVKRSMLNIRTMISLFPNHQCSRHMPYSIRQTRRAKRICLTVRSDGSVAVSAPPRVSLRCIDAFVREKEDWIARARAKISREHRAWPWKGTYDEYRANKAKALAIVHDRLAYYNVLYGFTWKRVTIRNQRTRWGSCSRAGALSFNYRVVFLAPELVDYLIVHELCHRKEMNHSPRFWALVAQTQPEYRAHRAALRRIRS